MGAYIIAHCLIAVFAAGAFMIFGFLTIAVSKICCIFIRDRSNIKWLPTCCNILMIFLMVAFVIVTAFQSAYVFVVNYAEAANGTDFKNVDDCGTAQKLLFPMAILSYCLLALTCCFCCSTCFHAWGLEKDDV